ncbi:MAG: hypothetical protein OIN88_12805 [Candidatus Methanoperedens sp.]|nr:hypothetical protein [Candidatus Methanoperedens sp.]MCZ7358828.1 hypothetical protein [Candidatus Methanoperedens sp.]HLB69718.1 hypothetical protein [Candidatus Methanoperedens sp.]
MEYINIKDKKYSLKILKLLTGQEELDIESIQENILIIAAAVDVPDRLPYLIETIKSLEIEDLEKFRFVLLRVQIDSQLHMNEDLEMYQKRLYVAQVMEKLLYGEIFLEEGEKDNDEEEEND